MKMSEIQMFWQSLHKDLKLIALYSLFYTIILAQS